MEPQAQHRREPQAKCVFAGSIALDLPTGWYQRDLRAAAKKSYVWVARLISCPSCRRNLAKTSFDSRRPRGVNRIFSSSRSNKFCSMHSAIAGENAFTASSPNEAARRLRSTPRFSRKPRKKLSSSEFAGDTGVRSGGAPARNLSKESGVANRTASSGPQGKSEEQIPRGLKPSRNDKGKGLGGTSELAPVSAMLGTGICSQSMPSADVCSQAFKARPS